MRESGRRVTAEYQRRGRFDWPGLNDASIFVHWPLPLVVNEE
jgi:hypothetical protein